ncbi:MAG TPA: hypothetical protein P5571_07780 [Candidatus Krumholzibacteria bacterium]|nr:hypothetical protein [Candidatus Krumholzibacteria bacterium]HRX51243.1 hypothetical protein [Candidatus Krumholzibacteria bacterium]
MQVNIRWIGVLAAAAWLGTAQAAPSPKYPKTPLPDRPAASASPLATAPDCDAATAVAIAPGDSLTFTGDTTGGASLVDRYGCNTWNESGPEAVYELTVTTTIRLHATLAAEAELDLMLLSDCEGDSCEAAHIAEFDAELAPGTWYVVVDGYAGAQGAFTLTLQARAGGLPQAACDGAEVVTAFDTLTGNLLDRPNLVNAFDCASFIENGGEAWYLLTVPPRSELTVTVTNQAFDAALWLFDGCGETPQCVDFTDAELSGTEESLLIVNDLGTPWELVLGVDSFHPILSSQGGDEFDGAFDLTFGLAVPAERATAGGLKRLFR